MKTYLLPLRKTNATIPFYIKIPHRCQFSRQYGIRTKAETSIINRIKGFLNLNRRDTWNDFKNIVKIAWPHKRRIFGNIRHTAIQIMLWKCELKQTIYIFLFSGTLFPLCW